MNISVKLTILFNDPFWIGIFEQEEKGIYKVCKVTFGAEPKEGDVLDYILKEFYKLNFSSSKVENKNIIEIVKQISLYSISTYRGSDSSFSIPDDNLAVVS